MSTYEDYDVYDFHSGCGPHCTCSECATLVVYEEDGDPT